MCVSEIESAVMPSSVASGFASSSFAGAGSQNVSAAAKRLLRSTTSLVGSVGALVGAVLPLGSPLLLLELHAALTSTSAAKAAAVRTSLRDMRFPLRRPDGAGSRGSNRAVLTVSSTGEHLVPPAGTEATYGPG